VRFVGRLSAGDKQDGFSANRLGGGASTQQMSMVDGVEASAQTYFVPHWQTVR
jgi:hypothetical protein